jgi:D-arginine dehydrogenase
MRSFDFLVVGGGMGGASVGYELARDGAVALLEREAHLGFHSTGRSAAILMETYGNGPVRALTTGSRRFYEAPPDDFSAEPLVSRRGALVLAEAADAPRLRALHQAMLPLVSTVEVIGAEDLRRLVPCLAPERWAAGLLEPGAVDLDVHEVLQGYVRGLRARGGEVITGAEVLGVRRAAGAWVVATAVGPFTAPVLVNAAGAWADRLGALAGARPIGLTPLRRTALTVEAPEDPSAWPFVVDVDEQLYFKPDARRLLVSPADETPSEPCNAAPDGWDVAVAIERLERATTLRVSHVPHRWAGLRSFVRDRTPVVGPDPDVEGLVWLAAQGGYGIQTAPALARLCRALALGDGVPADLAALGLEAATVLPGRPGLARDAAEAQTAAPA